MADGTVPYQNPTTTDGLLDCESLTVAALTVKRERVQVSGATDVALATVTNAAPTTEYGLVVRNIPSGTQPVSGTVAATQSGVWNVGTLTSITNPVAVTGPLTDTQLRATAVPVSGTVSVTGVATEVTLATRLSESDFDSKTGALTEVAPVSDTASSGLNGRLQRIAQRITSLIALLPGALVGGRLDVNIGAPSTLPVSAVSLPLPTGATTLTEQQAQTTALQLIDNIVSGSGANITQLGGVNVSLNTGVRDTGTLRVTVATNDVVPASQSGTWNIGTVTNLDVALSTRLAESTFTTRINTQGQKTMAASTPVVLASDQASIPVTMTSTTITGSVAVTGPLTDAQLRATPVPISGSVTATSTATSTAVAPVYVEGSSSAISQDLSGSLRVIRSSFTEIEKWYQRSEESENLAVVFSAGLATLGQERHPSDRRGYEFR